MVNLIWNLATTMVKWLAKGGIMTSSIIFLGLMAAQLFHGFVDALEGNCRLLGCNSVVKFNLSTETCCGGTVYVKDFDENGKEKTKCCLGRNSTMYDVETQECCGGKVLWKDSPSQGCCQGKVHNKNVFTCCEGEIKIKSTNPCCGNDPVDPSFGLKCCGGLMYDIREQTCCNGEVFPGIGECCGNRVLIPARDKCCRHNDAANLIIGGFGTGTCCGLETYRPGEQLCCKSVVQNKVNRTTECCGNTTFDITRQVCCQGNVLPLEPGKKKRCCGGQLYDEDDQICCRDKVQPGGGRAKCCNDTSYQEEKQVCFNRLVLNSSVPTTEGVVRLLENSTAAFLSANQFECGGQLITRSREKNACCGKTAYNSLDHLCCELSDSSFEPVQKSPTHDRCCGRATYDSESHGCCNSTQVYHLENEICNENGVHQRYGDIESAKPCLNQNLNKDKVCKIRGSDGVPYNSNTSVCTPRGVVARPEGLEVCGNKTFRRDLFICCRGKLFAREVEDETQKCCPNPVDEETYRPASQTCFKGWVENIPEQNARTCKGRVYDNRTQECDVTGRICSIEKIEEKPYACWFNDTHFSYYNNETEKCCNGHVIDAVYTCCAEDSDCCDNDAITGYNRDTQVCCGGVLREVPLESMKNGCRGSHCSDHKNNQFLCCQEVPYENVGNELTCDGNMLSGRLPNNSILCRGKLFDHGTDCCGDRSYDKHTEICCGGVVENRTANTTCCGNHIYEPSNSDSLCCESSFYKNATGQECCGGVKYNPTNETCCTTGDKTYIFPSKDGLCCSNGEDFDDTLHTCCDGLVHKYITNGTCCGNDVIRDPTREGCFNNRIYQL